MVTSVLVKPNLDIEQSQSKVHGRVITTKVVGVTFEDRQEVIAKLHTGDLVWLDPEPDNIHDPNAVLVTRNNGETVGYINRHLAKNLTPYFERIARPVWGRVKFLTGSAFDGYALGLVISFKIPRFIDNYRNHKKHQMTDWED
jgi:hypothetical protein